MKRYIGLILIVLLLTGCRNATIDGIWKDPNGSTIIRFEDGQADFFDAEGTYTLKGNLVTIDIEGREINFKYKIKKEKLFIFLNDSELVFEKQ